MAALKGLLHRMLMEGFRKVEVKMGKTGKNKLSKAAWSTLCVLLLAGCSGQGAGNTFESAPSGAAPTAGLTQGAVPSTAADGTIQKAVPSVASGEPSPQQASQADRYEGCQKYAPSDKVKVYFAEDGTKQVVVQYGEKEAVFDSWDYDLSYGEPVFRQQEPEKGDAALLYIVLPTRAGEDSSLAAQEAVPSAVGGEICGEWHLLRLGEKIEELSDMGGVSEMSQYGWTDEARGEFRMKWEETEDGRCPVLYCAADPGLSAPFYAYPNLWELAQEKLELVQEDALHITERMLAYRRLGVRDGEKVVWLGALYDDILRQGEAGSRSVSSAGGSCFVPYAAVQYGEDWYERWIQSGEMRVLEPDCLLDLDGDGVEESISWRVTEENRTVKVSIMNQAGQQVSMELGDEMGDCDFRPFAASLDGSTVQLILWSRRGVANGLSFYRYEAGRLKTVGEELVCREAAYTVIDRTADGGLTFSVQADGGFRLGAVVADREYGYENGQLKERKPDFYDIRNTELSCLTAKRELELLVSPDGSESVVFPAGTRLRRLRCSELSDAPATGEGSSWGWLLLESVDTGEQGWLQLAADGKCMFPDGTAAEGDEIFDGIQDAR